MISAELPVHDPGLESLLSDRSFHNLLLVRLRRLSVAMGSNEDLLAHVEDLIRLIDEVVGEQAGG